MGTTAFRTVEANNIAWDLNSFSIEYIASGVIANIDPQNAKGQFKFKISATTPKWANIETLPLLKKLKLSFTKAERSIPENFNLSLTSENMSDEHKTTYEVDGVTYYIKNKSVVFNKQNNKISALNECESNELPTYFKSADDLNGR